MKKKTRHAARSKASLSLLVVSKDDVVPTIFKSRESRRLITKEHEGSQKMSLHHIKRWEIGLSRRVKYNINDEIMYMINGKCVLRWSGGETSFETGSAAFIPAGCEYRILATTPCEIIAVLSPPRLRSDWAGRPDLVALEPEHRTRKHKQKT